MSRAPASAILAITVPIGIGAQNPAFEVASVKSSKIPKMPGFPLDNSDAKTAGGRFSASTTLLPYISFAYKLSTSETNAVQSQLPKWAGMDLFEIEARGEGNPTKDQMRLMMQALLADRFRLACISKAAKATCWL